MSPVVPSGEAAVHHVFAEFTVLRVETGRAALSQSSRIWSFVDETALPASLAVALLDSGFRVGVGRAEAWGPIRDLLDALPEVRTKSDRALPNAAQAVEILLSNDDRDRTIFFVERSGRLVGRSFGPARPVLNFEYETGPDPRGGVRLRVVPELREPPGPMRYVRVGDAYLLQPEYRGRHFHELAFEVRIPPDGFLLIGPAMDVHRLPLLGRSFFVTDEAGARRESVYIIHPIVRRSATTPAALVGGPIPDGGGRRPPG